jgi:uridine kinase
VVHSYYIRGIRQLRYNDIMERSQLIDTIANCILSSHPGHPLRVAIDGVDAAGKTSLAEELAEALENQPRQVIRASVDGFHNPERIRRQKGSLSPDGFYENSYNYEVLIRDLLLPLGPEGSRRYRTAAFDYRQDKLLDIPFRTADETAILIMDGIFLLRPHLLPYWDLMLYVHVDFAYSVPRGVARDTQLFGSQATALQRYQQRYVPGQKRYITEARPLDKAHILIDNNKIQAPKIIRISPIPEPDPVSGPEG